MTAMNAISRRHFCFALLLIGSCGDNFAAPPVEPTYELGEEFGGGETTVFSDSKDAFSLAARNLIGARRDPFFTGNSLFNRNWVTAPASTVGIDGLGPTFNATACSSCHFRDGRGSPPKAGETFTGLLLRLSVPGTDVHGGPVDEPTYGGQFNHRSVVGVAAEGQQTVAYREVMGQFDDGTSYSLRVPTYEFSQLSFGAMATNTMVSPRVAPSMIGLGLLQNISVATILSQADETDANGDGISGRANYVWDPKSQAVQIGRFGWKANQPGLEQQNSGAFVGDMGITSPLFPANNCPSAQVGCATAPNGGDPEITAERIDQVTYYSRFLAVPVRRGYDSVEVLRGKALFAKASCTACHTPTLVTAVDVEFPELSNQTVRPFTDMLLHDMGPDLADNRPDFLATGNEWRTPALWGMGLVKVINGHTNFLHDGRARDANEAILWHGGEALAARDAYLAMNATERTRLLLFLESL